MATLLDAYRRGVQEYHDVSIQQDINPYLHQYNPLTDTIVDGDTLGKNRLVGYDTFESAQSSSNEKAKKLAAAGIGLAEQKKLGLAGKHELERQLQNNPNMMFDKLGKDTFGRTLLSNSQLADSMIESGTAVPTDRYNEKQQSVYNARQEKIRLTEPLRAQAMEIQREYNINRQKPGMLDRLGNTVDALQSGLQQAVVGTADFALDLVTPGDNTLLNNAKSAEVANAAWGYDDREANFQKKEALHNFKNEEYVASVMGMAASPELWGESLPMISEMAVGAGKFTALGKLMKLGTQGLKGADKIAEAKRIRDGATAMQKATLLGAENVGFLGVVVDQTNRHIEEFTTNNDGVGPTYGQIAGMTAMNVLQLGLDRFAFNQLISTKGGIQALKDTVAPLLKVIPDNALGTIAKKVATTTTDITAAMGEEAGQEYIQTWAEMLNTKAGTNKYGDWLAVMQNPEAQDEAIIGALAGAGMGAQMRAGVEIPGAILGAGKSAVSGVQALRTPTPQTEEQFLKQSATEDKVYDRTPIRETLSRVKDSILKGTGDLVEMFNKLNSVETDAMANDDTGSMKYIKEYKKKIADILTKQAVEEDNLPTLGSHPEDVIADLYESTANKTEIFESNIAKMATKAGVSAERLQQIRDEATVEEEATIGEMGFRTYGRKLRSLQDSPTPDAAKIEIIQSKMDNYISSQESARDTIKSAIDKYIGEILAGKLGKFQKTFTYGEKKTSTTWNVKGKGGIEELLATVGANPTQESIFKAMLDTTVGRLYQHKVRNVAGIKAEAKASGYNMSLSNKVVIPKGVSPKGKQEATLYKKRVEGANKVIAVQTTIDKDPKVSAMKAANSKSVNSKEYMEDDTVLVVAPKSPKGRDPGSMLMSLKNAKKFGLAKLREQLDKAIEAKATIITNVITNRSTMDWVVGAYLKENGYVEVNKDNELREKTGKWIKSEKAVMPKPKAEKAVDTKAEEKAPIAEVEVETVYKPVKDILKESSTKGKSDVSNNGISQIVDISKLVTMKNITENTSKVATGIDESLKDTITLMKQTMKILKGVIAGTKDETIYYAKDSLGRGLLYDAEGGMNQATATAIGMAAEEYIAYSSSLLRPKDKAELEKALGMGVGQMSPEAYKELKRVGIPRKMVIDALGKAVLGTLNLKRNEEVDTAIYDKLKSDLGMMAYLVTIKKGYIKETAIAATKYGKMIGQSNKTYNKDATITFATINRDNKKMDVGEIREAYKLIETETGTVSTMRKGPLSKPAEPKVSKMMEYGEDDTVEAARKNQITDVPDESVQGLNKLRTMKHVSVKSAVEWVRSNVQTAKEHMGYVSSDEMQIMSAEAAESAEASNMEIDKSVEELLANDMEDMWFEWYFTKNGRYMMDSNTINPQTDKLHRFIVIPEALNVTIDPKNDKHMMAYYMAVAQATGFAIDKKHTDKAMAQGKYIAENITGKELLEALSSKTKMDSINKDLKDAGLAEIEVEHLGHWLQAAESIDAYSKDTPFKTNLSAEFDAVTSGFGNRIMQMPIVTGAVEWAKKIGAFVGVKDKELSMNDKLDSAEDKLVDSYQTLAKGIERGKIVPTTDVHTKVWKALSAALPAVDADGIVTKELRTLFKDPFMTFNYSAGLISIKKSLGNGMVSTILNELAMQQTSKGGPLSDGMKALYEELGKKDVIGRTGGKKLYELLREQNAGEIETKIMNSKTKKPYKLDEYLSQLIQESYGMQVEEILVEAFSPFMKANTTINAAMKMMFAAWKDAYDKQVTAAGKDGKVVTAEDKLEILLGLRSIFPIIRGPLSEGYEDGISIVDSINSPSDPKYGATQTHIIPKSINGYDQKTVKVQAMVEEYEAAMNAGSVIPFHFIDGAEILALINKSKGGQFVHDAYIPPITDAIEDILEYNKAVYDIGKNYNLADALVESIERIKDYTGTIEVTLRSNEFPTIEESGKHTLTLADVKHMVYELAIQTNEARSEYYKNDMTIAHMAGMPGSAYVATGDKTHTEKTHENTYSFNPVREKELSKEAKAKKAEKQVEETKEDMADIMSSGKETELTLDDMNALEDMLNDCI